MLNSIYYGLALIAIMLIMRWYILNDGKGQNDGTVGFLGMKNSRPTPPAPTEKSGKRSFRRKP